MIGRAGHGDEDAQSWLYRQYCKAMYNICVRMTGHSHNAEDVLQDAFILAFKNLHQVKNPESFAGWLRRIVVNECIRYSKRSLSWTTLNENHGEYFFEETTEWWTDVTMELIQTEIKNLPEGCRQVFVLYVLEDYSHKEIAESVGISESTSKSQYHRARQLLKERITKQISVNG